MQNATETERTGAENYERIQTRILIAGEPMTAPVIGALEYSAASCDSELKIGTACAASSDFRVLGVDLNSEGAEAEIQYKIGDGIWKPLLSGTVSAASADGDSTQITVSDAMKMRGGAAFQIPEELAEECTAADGLEAVAAQLGVNIDTETAAAAAVFHLEKGLSDLPNGASLQASAGLLAGVMGGFAAIDRNGKLAVKFYHHTGQTARAYAGQEAITESPTLISGILFHRTETVEESTEAGTIVNEVTHEYEASGMARGGSYLTVDNPLARQELAEQAWQNIGTMELYGGEYSAPGGILMEPGDIIDVSTSRGRKTTAIANLRLSLDGGCKASITGAGSPPLENAPKGTLSRQISQLRNSLGGMRGNLNKAIAKTVYAYSGITNIANYDEKTGWAIAKEGLYASILDKTEDGEDKFKEALMNVTVVRAPDGTLRSLADIFADVITLKGDVKVIGNFTVDENGIVYIKAPQTHFNNSDVYFVNGSRLIIGGETITIYGNEYKDETITSTSEPKHVLGWE